MDYTDPGKQFCSEVAAAAYQPLGVTLWMGLSHLSTPGVTCTPGRSQGIDYVTAVYEDSQWKLCASYFQSGGKVQPGFIK